LWSVATEDRKIVLFNLMNDIIQNSRNISTHFVDVAGKPLIASFQSEMREQHPPTVKHLRKLLKIWEDRSVLADEYLQALRHILKGAGGEGGGGENMNMPPTSASSPAYPPLPVTSISSSSSLTAGPTIPLDRMLNLLQKHVAECQLLHDANAKFGLDAVRGSSNLPDDFTSTPQLRQSLSQLEDFRTLLTWKQKKLRAIQEQRKELFFLSLQLMEEEVQQAASYSLQMKQMPGVMQGVEDALARVKETCRNMSLTIPAPRSADLLIGLQAAGGVVADSPGDGSRGSHSSHPPPPLPYGRLPLDSLPPLPAPRFPPPPLPPSQATGGGPHRQHQPPQPSYTYTPPEDHGRYRPY
jgi:hypothetical protein